MALAESLAARTEGFTGADLSSLCQRAAMHALGRQSHSLPSSPLQPEGGMDVAVDVDDFEAALPSVLPSVTAEMLGELERWRAKQGGADLCDGQSRAEDQEAAQGFDFVPVAAGAPVSFAFGETT